MGWADEHISKLSLSSGPGVTFRTHSHSMEPAITAGQEVTCYPWQVTNGVHPGDIVLCTVNNSQYLGAVKAVNEVMEANDPGPQYLIGDLKGREHGWTGLENIHGVYRTDDARFEADMRQIAKDIGTPKAIEFAEKLLAAEPPKPKRKYNKKAKS